MKMRLIENVILTNFKWFENFILFLEFVSCLNLAKIRENVTIFHREIWTWLINNEVNRNTFFIIDWFAYENHSIKNRIISLIKCLRVIKLKYAPCYSNRFGICDIIIYRWKYFDVDRSDDKIASTKKINNEPNLDMLLFLFSMYIFSYFSHIICYVVSRSQNSTRIERKRGFCAWINYTSSIADSQAKGEKNIGKKNNRKTTRRNSNERQLLFVKRSKLWANNCCRWRCRKSSGLCQLNRPMSIY